VNVDPPAKLSKAHQRRHGTPLLKFKRLEIEAIKTAFRKESGEHTGIKQSLHICRGHFKDYRQSGLFGHHKGLYWWDMHVRGSADVGTVVKDYAVVVQ
jgi:hypothetical protein